MSVIQRIPQSYLKGTWYDALGKEVRLTALSMDQLSRPIPLGWSGCVPVDAPGSVGPLYGMHHDPPSDFAHIETSCFVDASHSPPLMIM